MYGNRDLAADHQIHPATLISTMQTDGYTNEDVHLLASCLRMNGSMYDETYYLKVQEVTDENNRLAPRMEPVPSV